jgi:HSP20 family molecular chaperone IbpA
MSSIAVEKVRELAALPRGLFQEMSSIEEKIRAKAYQLFESRGGEPGRELDDWLQAERQLMWLPETEIDQKEKEFQIRVNVQGLEARDLRLLALPQTILLHAEPKSRESKLFLRIDLASPIDADRATARLEKGILQLSVPKLRQAMAA